MQTRTPSAEAASAIHELSRSLRSRETPFLLEPFRNEKQANHQHQHAKRDRRSQRPVVSRAEQTTMFEIMMPLGPPSNNGARKPPRLSTNANVAPASTPGIESGKITRQKVCAGEAPRSLDASTRFRGMCSSDA